MNDSMIGSTFFVLRNLLVSWNVTLAIEFVLNGKKQVHAFPISRAGFTLAALLYLIFVIEEPLVANADDEKEEIGQKLTTEKYDRVGLETI